MSVLSLFRPRRLGSSPRPYRPHLEPLEDRTALSTTVLTVSPNPATFGQAVTLTATVTESGGDTGQPGTSIIGTDDLMGFLDGSATLAIGKVTPKPGTTNQGVASFTTTGLGIGNHLLMASYSGMNSLAGFASDSNSNLVGEVINPQPPPPPPPPLADVTPLVSVTPRRFAGGAVELVEVRNVSGQVIDGPLYLVLAGLPRRVRLRGAQGATRAHGPPGSPFKVDAVTLLPGGYADFLVQFSNPGHKHVRFSAEVFAGPGAV